MPAGHCSSFLERLDQWLGKRPHWVIGALVFLWIAIRVALFDTVINGPLYHMYKWQASDNYFFDEWARTLAGGDWLNRQPLHPYHEWHGEFAGYYFGQHPDKLNQILNANPDRDSTFVAGKVLWNEWYGGNTYHQEPLYAYALAVLYAFTGNGIYWMMVLQGLLGVLSGALLWLITRRHFGDTVAMLTGLLYLFCGIILFQEALILRTSWIVFFTLLAVWAFDNALERRTVSTFFIIGVIAGLGYLLQSVFAVFLVGSLAIYCVRERKKPKLFARNTAFAVLGFFMVFSPVILRNAVVGAPIFSTSSVGAVTFAVANVHNTNAVSKWAPEASKCAEILGKTNGEFGPAILASLETHPSAGSYIHLLWSKFQRICNGLEWPNNENYYFYKVMVPALDMAFLDFYWIVWAGAAGILFSLYYRKKCHSLYLAILIQLAVMLGFYVLGRFRTPLAVLLLPFASYALKECLRIMESGWKESFGKIAVSAMCFFTLTYSHCRPATRMLDPTDYTVMYDIVYYDRVRHNADAGFYKQAIEAHAEFLQWQPDFVKTARSDHIFKSLSEISVLNLFAEHYRIHSFLCEDSDNKEMALSAMEKSKTLKQIANNSQKYLKK